MKKTFFVISASLFCFCISCNTKSESTGTTQGEKNIATVHAVNDAIESGDVSTLDQYIAADAVDHAGEHGDIKGLDSIKANLAYMHNSYKDMKLDELQDAASGDYVFSLTRFTGTSTRESMGAPGGTSFDMNSVQVIKFDKNGKAVEHWEYMQMSDMMKMMPQSGMDHMMDKKMDSTKKM
jgi:ketosteroid isomerase-like protein